MTSIATNLLSCGIYTIPDAARFTGIAPAKFRHWCGISGGKPVLRLSLEPIDGQHALTFLELLECKAIGLLRTDGVTLAEIRRVREQLSVSAHPLIDRLVEPRIPPWYRKVLQPFLEQLDFEDSFLPFRWWVAGRDAAIVADPAFNFGAPIVGRYRVPADALANAVKAEGGDLSEVARWYAVPVLAVEQAVAFQARLAGKVPA